MMAELARVFGHMISSDDVWMVYAIDKIDPTLCLGWAALLRRDRAGEECDLIYVYVRGGAEGFRRMGVARSLLQGHNITGFTNFSPQFKRRIWKSLPDAQFRPIYTWGAHPLRSYVQSTHGESHDD
jgi:hypothetical protein